MPKKANENKKVNEVKAKKTTTKQNANNKTAAELKKEIEQLSTQNAFSGAIKENKAKRRKKTAIAAATVLGATAAIVTPVVIFRTKFQEYEISVESTAENFQSYSVTLRKGSTILNLKQKLNVFEGHTLVGIYQDENCTNPYSDSDKVTKDTKVYLKYEKLTYSISLPTATELFEIKYSTSVDISKIEWGDSFTFRIETGPYTFENATVTANGLVLTPDADGYYLIPFVSSNIVVRVNDLNLTDYTISTIPSNVTVFNNRGQIINSNSQIFAGETLTFVYTETEHYSMSTFEVNETPVNNNVALTVNEDITINYEEVYTRTLSFQEVSGGYACKAGFEWDGNGECMSYYEQDVVMPSKYHNLPVVQAFGLSESENRQLESNNYNKIFNSVTIPDTVTTITESYKHFKNIYFDSTKLEFIAENSFEGCTLEPFTLTSKLTSHNSFGGASELKSLTFDSSLTQITDDMIGNAKIKEITIPSTINSISSNAFSSCQFESIKINSDNVYKTITEEGFFGYEIAEQTTITVPKVIASSNSNTYLNNSNYFKTAEQGESIVFTKEIAKFNVDFTGNGDIYLSYELSSAKYGRLQNGIDKVEYGDTITITYHENAIPSREGKYMMSTFEVDGEPVENNYSVKVTGDITVKFEEIDATGMEFTKLSNGDYACKLMCLYSLDDWSLIESVADNAVIPSKYNNKEVVEILSDDWTDNSILKSSVTVPATIKKLNSCSLAHFQKVIIDTTNLEEIETDAFVYSEYATPAEIDSFTITNKLTKINGFGGAKINNFVFAEGVTQIVDRMFENIEFGSMVLPNSIQKIGKYAFANDLDGNNNVAPEISITLNSGLKEIGAGAFMGSGITEITLPNTLETIGDNAFAYTLIKDIEIPSSVKTIGNSAFAADPVSNVAWALETVKLNEGLESLGASVFFCRWNLKEIVIPNSVTSLGKGALRDCTNKVTFGTGLISLPEQVLYTTLEDEDPMFGAGASKISELTIPSNIKTIGANAFHGCEINKLIVDSAEIYGLIDSADFYGANITQSMEIHVLKSIVDAGDPSSPLTYSEYLNNESTDSFVKLEAGNYYKFIKLKDYYGQEGYFTTTTVSNGVKYLGTDENAYCLALCLDDTSYRNIVLEEGCETIADNAFKETGIETVKLSSTVKTIGSSAFENCTNLNSVIISDSLIEIGKNAFKNCEKIKEITIGENVKYIQENAFEGCTALTKVYINSAYIYKDALDIESCGELIKNAIEIIVAKSVVDENSNEYINEKYDIEADIATIEPRAFSMVNNSTHYYFYSNAKITKVVLPSGVKFVGFNEDGTVQNSFHGAVNLSEITLNDDLELIGASAFLQCPIKNLVIPNSVTEIQVLAFAWNTCLEQIKLGLGVKTLGEECFSGSTNLTKLELNEGLEFIGGAAFAYCESLTTVNLPSTVKEIGRCAFLANSSLEIVNLNEGLEAIEYGALGETAIKHISIPSSVKTIGEDAFAGCTNLKNVTINSENIYKSIKALEDCGSLIANAEIVTVPLSILDKEDKTILLRETSYDPNTYEPSGSFSPLYSDEFAYFYNIDYISTFTNFTLPENTKEIGEYFFYAKTNLTSVELNEGLEIIGDCAFARSGITSIEMPSSLKTIGSMAFYETLALVTVTLNEGLETVGHGAFAFCDIESVEIPNSVTVIENSVFAVNENLTEVIIGSGIQTIPSLTFVNCNKLSNIVIPSTVTTIDESAFSGCTNLKNVTINSETVYKSIKTLDDCGELIKNADVVMVKSSLITDLYDTSILLRDARESGSSFVVLEGEDYTYFYNNDYMATVTDFEFPSDVTTMGSYFFENANLKSVTFNDTLDDIGYQAFASQYFDELTIASNINLISSEAFMFASIGKVTLLSEQIYKDLIATDEYTCGGLAAAANTLYVPKTIVDANTNSLYDNAENFFKFEAGEYYAFVPVDSSATELVVPEGVTSVDLANFGKKNQNIISLTLPSSVESIVNSSSYLCHNLKSLTIESKTLYDSINWYFQMICDELFTGCEIRVLKSVDDGTNNTLNNRWIKIDEGEYNTYLRINDGYTSGYNYTKITEENNIRYVGDNANPYHTMLTVLDRSLENYEVNENTVIIGYRAFSFTTNMKTVNLPNSVQVLDRYSFSYAYALEELVLPDSVTTVGDGAFNCGGGAVPMKIKSLVISKNVTNIGEDIFFSDVDVSSMTIESATWYADPATSFRATVIEFKIAKDIYDAEHEYSNTDDYLIFESENYIHCINKSRAGVTDDIEAGVVYTGIATDGTYTYLSTASDMYHTKLY